MAKPLNTMLAFGPRHLASQLGEVEGENLLIGINEDTDEVVDIAVLDDGTTAEDVTAIMTINNLFTEANKYVLVHRSSDFAFEGLFHRGENRQLLDELVLVGNRMRSTFCDNEECCPAEGSDFTL